MDTPTHASPSVLILGGEETETLIRAAAAGLDCVVRRIADTAGFGEGRPRADLVIVDSAWIDGPDTVRQWLDAEVLDAATALLLVAPSPVRSEEYREWLEAGVWEVVRTPVDPSLLGLRLRNLLGGRGPRGGSAITPAGPYPWPTLVRATEETLALAKRVERPVACVAVAVAQQENSEPREADRLMYRLGVAAREWVRGYDLVGLNEQHILLAVLPDTSRADADILAPRLGAALERALRRAGVVASLQSSTSEWAEAEDQSATDFLLGTLRAPGARR